MSPLRHFASADILQIFERLPVGIAAISPSGTLLHLNRKLEDLLGMKTEDARGLPCRHVLRTRSCVNGCPLGCRPPDAADAFFTPAGGIESDLVNFRHSRLAVRLTHFAVPGARGEELFRLDVLEDLTDIKTLERQILQADGGGKLIGKSPAMERILAQLPFFAASGAPVLLTGETGTGKDLLAESLHQASSRVREPFVRVNLGPMPEELLVAEFFGRSGAGRADVPGRFRQAAEGILYLSELADIPIAVQARLVHFLDEGRILPLGAERELKLNVRLIVATNRNPAQLVEDGCLSAELFHRLNVIRLHLPPLRERREDLDFLLQHFLALYAARFKKATAGFDAAAREVLAGHNYPGNIRELRNIVEYAAMVAPDGMIGVEHLPMHIAALVSPPARGGSGKTRREKL